MTESFRSQYVRKSSEAVQKQIAGRRAEMIADAQNGYHGTILEDSLRDILRLEGEYNARKRIEKLEENITGRDKTPDEIESWLTEVLLELLVNASFSGTHDRQLLFEGVRSAVQDIRSTITATRSAREKSLA